MARATHDLLLLRHTPVAVAPGTCYGQLDLPLAEPAGPALAAAVAGAQAVWAEAGARALPADAVRWVCSPAQRCQALAQALAPELSQPPEPPAWHLDPRWLELHFGRWEGRAWADIPRTESDPWADDPWHRAPPGGETLAQLATRVQAAVQDLVSVATAPALTVVVAHAGPIRCAVAHALGLPLTRLHDLALDPGRLAWLRHHPAAGPRQPARWQLMALNR